MIQSNNVLFNLRSQPQVELLIQEERLMKDCTRKVIKRNDQLNENIKQSESLRKCLILKLVKSCSNQRSHLKVSTWDQHNKFLFMRNFMKKHNCFRNVIRLSKNSMSKSLSSNQAVSKHEWSHEKKMLRGTKGLFKSQRRSNSNEFRKFLIRLMMIKMGWFHHKGSIFRLWLMKKSIFSHQSF